MWDGKAWGQPLDRNARARPVYPAGSAARSRPHRPFSFFAGNRIANTSALPDFRLTHKDIKLLGLLERVLFSAPAATS